MMCVWKESGILRSFPKRNQKYMLGLTLGCFDMRTERDFEGVQTSNRPVF
jgi:hypothetical protein